MRIVKKFDKFSTPEVVRRLEEAEAKLLGADCNTQQQLLQDLHGYWVLCDCGVPSTVKHFHESNHYFLAKVKEREEHKTECPLYSITNQQSNPNQQITASLGTAFSFSTQVNEQPGEKPVITTSDSGQKVQRTDKLYALVAGLINDAKANVLMYGQKPDFEAECKKLSRAAMRYTVGGKSLYQYLYFGLGKLKEICEMLPEREHMFSGRHKPQAVVLAHISSMKKEYAQWQITIKDGWDITLPRMTMVTRLNGMFSLTKGPLLVACVVAELPVSVQKINPNQKYGITRVFVTPAVNNNSFMIVDSGLERTFAKIAIKQLLRVKNDVKVEKPLIPKMVEGIPILPDFIVKYDKEDTVVEVMGKWDDEVYRQRKERTMIHMLETYGTVVCVGKDTAATPDLFYEECNAKLNRLLRANELTV